MTSGPPGWCAFERGAAENYLLELGSRQFIPCLRGPGCRYVAGDSREIPVTFPEDYGSAELAGKAVVFEVALKEIR